MANLRLSDAYIYIYICRLIDMEKLHRLIMGIWVLDLSLLNIKINKYLYVARADPSLVSLTVRVFVPLNPQSFNPSGFFNHCWPYILP